tara:strand:+ start:714 stop:1100 length:387 start_codon:yes stop_codon:yes gene_type:complete
MSDKETIKKLSEMFNSMSIFYQNLDSRVKNLEGKRVVFKKPTLDELSEYMLLMADSIGIINFNHKEEASNMFDYYEGINWESKRSKIKKWKPVARNWVKRYKQFRKDTPSGSPKLGFKNQANLEAMGG